MSFDATGTLFHAPRLGAVYAEVLARHGTVADRDHLAVLVPEVWREISCRVPLGGDRFADHPDGARGFWRDFLERLTERLEAAPPSPFAAAELYERFAGAEAWEVYPDVRPVLDALAAAGIALAVTSNFDRRLPRLLAALGLGERFATVVTSERVGVEKPHPVIFERLLAELDLPAADVLHVGDDRRLDLEGAQAVGMAALLLDRSGKDGDLATLAALPELIAAWR